MTTMNHSVDVPPPLPLSLVWNDTPYLLLVPGTEGAVFVLNPATQSCVRLDGEEVNAILGFASGQDLVPTGDRATPGVAARGHTLEVEAFSAACQTARSEQRFADTIRIGFVVDELTDEQAAESARDAASRVMEGTAAQVFLHLWIGEETSWTRCSTIFTQLAVLGSSRSIFTSLVIDGTLNVSEPAEAAIADLGMLALGGRQVTIRLGHRALRRPGGATALGRHVFAWQAILFRHRFSPSYLLEVTPNTTDVIGCEVFEELCFSGVYPRNVITVFGADDAPLAGLCEVYETDWACYKEAAPRLLSRSTHRLLEPLALGFANVVRGYISCGKRWPRTSGCPFPRQGLVYAGGIVGRCPVAAVLGLRSARSLPSVIAAPLGHAATPTWDDAWTRRGPHNIRSCQRCRVAPLCGSGCAVRAVEAHGRIMAPDCPPVTAILAVEGAIASAGSTDGVAA